MSISSTGLYGSATIVNSDLFTDVETLKETVTNLNTLKKIFIPSNFFSYLQNFFHTLIQKFHTLPRYFSYPPKQFHTLRKTPLPKRKAFPSNMPCPCRMRGLHLVDSWNSRPGEPLAGLPKCVEGAGHPVQYSVMFVRSNGVIHRGQKPASRG